MTVFEVLQKEFGSLYRMAKLLGITPNAVYMWKIRGVIPVAYVKSIEALSEKRIDRAILRPDVFGE